MDPKDVKEHVESSDRVHLFVLEKDIVGFAGYITLDSILYLNGVVVKKTFQGKGYLSKSLSLVLDNYDCDYLALRTQNPVMYYIATRVAKQNHGKVYPNMYSSDIPSEIKEVGCAVCKSILNCDLPDDFIFRWRLWKKPVQRNTKIAR